MLEQVDVSPQLVKLPVKKKRKDLLKILEDLTLFYFIMQIILTSRDYLFFSGILISSLLLTKQFIPFCATIIMTLKRTTEYLRVFGSITCFKCSMTKESMSFSALLHTGV